VTAVKFSVAADSVVVSDFVGELVVRASCLPGLVIAGSKPAPQRSECRARVHEEIGIRTASCTGNSSTRSDLSP
jgi:hypothetical protein